MRFIKAIFLGILLSLSYFDILFCKQTLTAIENQTNAPITLYDTLKILPGSTNTEGWEIKSKSEKFKIEGVGRNDIVFTSGQVIQLYPLYGLGLAWLDEEFRDASVTVVFQAKAEAGDIQVAFGTEFSTDYIYKIIIGGDGNKISSILKKGVIKTHITRDENPEAMAGILSTQESDAYAQYWFWFQRGLVAFGKGKPGENVILSWRDPDFDSDREEGRFVNRVAVSSKDKLLWITNIMLLPALSTIPPKHYYGEVLPLEQVKQEEPKLFGVQDNFVRYGSIVKIGNSIDGKKLQVISGTAKVACDIDGTFWIIKGPNGTPSTFKLGELITVGSVIRLESFDSRQNLGVKEAGVEIKGSLGKGDSSDNWKIEVDGKGRKNYLEKTDKFFLISSGNKVLSFKQGDQMVGLSDEKTTGVPWQVDLDSYNPPLSAAELPAGTIVSLKQADSGKYLSAQGLKGGMEDVLYYGDYVTLKNISLEKITLEGILPKEITNYFVVGGGYQLEVATSPLGRQGVWKLINRDNQSSTQEVRFGDSLYLQSINQTLLADKDRNLAVDTKDFSNPAVWQILNSENPLNRGFIHKGSAICFQSINKKYVSMGEKNKITLKDYSGKEGVWIVDREGEEKIQKLLLFANADSASSFSTKFRILRSAGNIGFQSLLNNQNLTASKKFGWKLFLSDSTFYKDKINDQKFLMYKRGDDYFILSLNTDGVINNASKVGMDLPLTTEDKGISANFIEQAKFKMDILSVPKLKILEATYAAVEDKKSAFDVTEEVQSLVNGTQLIIPAGKYAKKNMFGDPAPAKSKNLKITYEGSDGNQIKQTVSENDALFVGVNEELTQNAALDVSGMNGAYVKLNYPLRVSGTGSFIVDVNAADSFYIGFMGKNEKVFGTDEEFYEIEIGAKNNMEVILRKGSQHSQIAYVSTPKILEDGIFKTFWVSIDGGLILVGQGKLGEGLLLAKRDNNPIENITSVCVSCGLAGMQCKNFRFAPSVGLDVPQNMTKEYKQKFETYRESSRTLKIFYPFTYYLYYKFPQIKLIDQIGKMTDIQAIPIKGDIYEFYLTINSMGDPEIGLEHAPTPGGVRKALGIASSALSIASGATMQVGAAVASVPDPRAQAIGAGIMAGGGVVSAVGQVAALASSVAFAPATDIRTEAYKGKQAGAFSDPQVQANNLAINAKLVEISGYNFEDPLQFKKTIDSYRDVLSLIVNSENVSPTIRKRIQTDLTEIMKASEKQNVNYYDSLISMLFDAHYNPFLFTKKGDEPFKEWLYAQTNQIERRLFKLKKEVDFVEHKGEVFWLEQEISPGNGSILFEVDGARDIFVEFSTERKKVRESENIVMYEVIIGGGGNSINFRLGSAGYLIKDVITHKTPYEGSLMPAYGEFKKYWVSLSTKPELVAGRMKKVATLSLGFGDFKKENIVRSWKDNEPPEGVRYPGISNFMSKCKFTGLKVGKPVGECEESDLVPVYAGIESLVKGVKVPETKSINPQPVMPTPLEMPQQMAIPVGAR